MKKKSRQQAYQERLHEQGLCITCGKKVFSKWYCKDHTEAVRKRARDRYRKKKGIALDAPLVKQGRKQIGR